MRAPSTFQLPIVQSMSKGAVRRTALWLRLWFYIIEGFTNALWKKSLTMAKCGMNIFWLSCIIPHWQKPRWMVCAFVNCAMVLKKRLNFFYFQWEKEDQVRSEYLRSYLNWLHNWQLKSRRRSHALKGSHSMGDGRIFLKNRRDVSFNQGLSNEPTFGLIHLAGQYL